MIKYCDVLRGSSDFSWMATVADGGMILTAQEICDAALCEFEASPRGPRIGDRRAQKTVEFGFLSSFDGSLAEFTDAFVRPAIRELARQVPEDVVFEELQLPEPDGRIEGARSGCLRYVAVEIFTATGSDEVTGEPTDYDFVMTGRFDVLYELA